MRWRRGSAAILGKDFRDNALAIDAMREGVRLTGFAGLPTYNRGNGLAQYLFVNGRPVRDQLLLGALRARLCRRDEARPPPGGGAVRLDLDPSLSTSTSTRPRRRCASAIPAWCAG